VQLLTWLIAAAAIGVAIWMALRWLQARDQLRALTARLSPAERADDAVQSADRYIARTTRIREELEAENRRLGTILAALDDAVIVVGRAQQILSVNDAALELFPTSFATVRGRTVIEMTGDHEIAALARRCIETGERQEETIEVSSSGRILRAIAVPAHDEVGNVLLLARDVTQVQHLQTVRRELVQNVSHELRTPLGSIKIYVETLLDGGLEVPGMAEDWLKKINDEVDELTQLVAELLELARLESGRVLPVFSPIDIAELGQRAIERLAAQAERAGITLVGDFPPDLPPVRGDRRMLEGALVNLIHNAVKFTPSDGTVTVGATWNADGSVSLSVEDTGVGIPRQHLPRLFERFYKEDAARSGGGTGLGLAIVKHVALAHHGTVGVESTPGLGSQFRITVPTIAGSVDARRIGAD
jgi:two-component system phosphate regulon sensor histidine kinase PhoR